MLFVLVKYDCGQITNQMTSYFQNPGWPEASQDRIVCTLTIELQPDVLQVLIEFLFFEVIIIMLRSFLNKKITLMDIMRLFTAKSTFGRKMCR